MIGSVYERHPVESRDFPLFSEGSRFTDDTVLTLAVANAILVTPAGERPDYRTHVISFGRRWPGAGFGKQFFRWLWEDDPQPYNSFGNGSAMRVSPVAHLFNDEETVLDEARRSAEISHDHSEGVKGAQSVALAVFLARKGASKDVIRSRIAGDFGYDLSRSVAEIQPGYSFDVTCQGSVPEAIVAFLDSTDFESAVRNAVFLGGDADTQACVAGAIAEAFYGGVAAPIEEEVVGRLDPYQLEIVSAFRSRFA